MLTAILAVRNLFGEHHDIWGVNADEEYHEEIPDMEFDVGAERHIEIHRMAETQPLVPIRIDRPKR
jgi:hypothetical protein